MSKHERTDLSTYPDKYDSREPEMFTQHKKKSKQLDLLKMPNPERIQLIKEIKENLRRKTTETKLWQSLLEVESLTINENIVYRGDQQLTGLFLDR
jgi:hypothetical protein